MQTRVNRINPDFNAIARSELTVLDWKFQATIMEATHDNPDHCEHARKAVIEIADQYRDLFFRQFKSLDAFEDYLDKADPDQLTLEYIHVETMRFIHNPDNNSINPFLRDADKLCPGQLKEDIDADFQKNFLLPYRNFLRTLTSASGPR